MKLKNLIYSIPLAALLIAAGTGCKKNQFNINRNPNDPTDSTVTYDVVLPAALHATGNLLATQFGPLQNWMGFWARSGTYAPNVTEETYQITTTFGNGIWNGAYDNAYDYNIVQTKARLAGAGMYEGIARIMKAVDFQILVDVYGNVPYFQALKGSANPTPAYDNGLAIYQDLLRQIDTGIALIKAASVTATSPDKDVWKNDIMFGDPVSGTISLVPTQKLRWAQFGNSLKLRLLIHAYAVSAINKTAEIAIINTEGSGYLQVDAQVQPGYKADRPMPFHGAYKTNAAGGTPANNVYYAANKWGVDYYKVDGDPRQVRFYEPGTGGLIGVAYGAPPINSTARSILAGIGPGLYKTTASPQIVFSAAEAYYLRAEARLRGWITTGPTTQQLYESGILASFTYLGVPNAATEVANYLAYNSGFPDVDITAPALAACYPAGGLATILSQKWFSLNGINTLEVWTDFRRVPFTEVSCLNLPNAAKNFIYGPAGGYNPGPPISVSPQNTATSIPVRYLYPQTEYNYNPANVGGQGSINQFTSRIFWDIN